MDKKYLNICHMNVICELKSIEKKSEKLNLAEFISGERLFISNIRYGSNVAILIDSAQNVSIN